MFKVINGVRYHIHVEGKGDPLVLLHGFTGSIVNWEPFFSLFKKRFMVIAVDLIGHGKTESPQNEKRYSMENTVDDLAEILSFLKLKKVNILGYSMGGRVAVSFASTYPDRVKSLVLESSSPGLITDIEREERRKSDSKLAQFIDEKGIAEFVKKWENIPLFASQQSLPEHKKERIRNQRLLNSKIGLANSLRGMGTGSQPSWWSNLENFPMPILLLVGALDVKYCEIANRMYEKLPQSKKIKINNAGHTIHVEQPEIFGKIVMDFLNKEK